MQFLLAVGLTATALLGSEHHGIVRSGGLPIPGATVTASRAGKKIVTTTDERGYYSFPDLPDGIWNIEIEMLGFARLTREVGIMPQAPSPEWELNFLPPAALARSAAAAPATPAPAKQAAAPKPPSGPAAQNATSRASNARPALAGAQSPAQGQRPGGFRRVDVNASAEAEPAGVEAGMTNNELASAELNQSAADSLLVNGSMSRGLDVPQQNDWFGGPGRGMGMDGMGPGMGLNPSGLNGDTPMGIPGADGAATAGRGGPGGGPGFGPGGPGGRGFGGGFPGGGFGGRGGGPGGGGRGGRGGPGDQRAANQRPGWQGRANTMAFGNGRRNPRMRYNGNLSFTLDNSVWDARSFSVNGQDTLKPAYAKARASMMFGGPLKIPKLLNGQKGMFMFNYSLNRSRNGQNQVNTMPSLLERGGDFSRSVGAQGPVTIYDPLTGNPFADNLIPANRISSAATGLLKFFPQPNGPGYRYNYQVPIVSVTNSDNINTRLNQTVTKKDRLAGGLGYQGSDNTAPNLFGFVDNTTGRGLNTNIMWSHNFTTRVISNLRYTFSRQRSLASPFFANREDVATELGIHGVSTDPRNWGPPNLSFQNFASLSDGNASLTRNQTSSVGESLIWIHGTHNITLGGDYRRQQINRLSDSNGRGSFTFTGLTTSAAGGGPTTGFDFADFLLGRPDTSSIRYGNGNLYFRTSAYDFYVTDDWRMSQKFSLNFGIRYDYGAPIYELYNHMVNLDLAPGFTAIAQVLPGAVGPYSGQAPVSLVNPDRNNFSPRIGFAWRPATKKSTVVRGGYGWYYNTSVYNTIANNMAQQPPFAQTLSVATSPLNLLTLENGFLAAPSQTITNTFAIDPNYRTGYAQIWQLAIQQDLGHALVGTITYNGTKGTRLDQQSLPNSLPPGSRLPLPGPAGYTYEQSNGNSIFHGVTFQLNRRFRSGISANALYTYAKVIDDAGLAQNYLDLSAERAVTNRRHVLNLNWQYSTGVGARGGTLVNGWKGALMKDWTVTNSITIQSGMPLTVTVGGNRATTTGTGITGAVRADATGLPLYDAPPGEPFNFAAFAAPPAGQWGNAGRNVLTGPATFGLNASMGRVFRLGERRSVDLRFEATNALNHVTIPRWNTVFGTNSFGLPASVANPMRSLTAVLRFRF